ncbi:dolichyl-phosphate beta-D-mannosyltransferase [Aeromicrobium sp. A1-2]|uniref:polyprenol monophosphomannose synthase n=1 Tax=Aeromicrobium sp. A1-2 TaxID=2107713 RepID=UPI000E49E72F|nr:polyprenol monophosphomannose synthase [Aeromicrobium sp. A1-2]AXT84649.1 dolichyl-phosphate beta-D-mannosyltransferase [Aeromicrobium sp. A1-2]
MTATTGPTARTIVIIPTFNEADGIEIVLDAVLRAEPSADILVVDDNSPDGTAALVTAHPSYPAQVFLLNRPDKDGLGAAYRAGFAWAQDRDYDVIVQMDADLSHPPAKIPELIAALQTSDIAIGSRYVTGGGVSNWSRRRRLISWAGNAYVRAVLGLTIHDATAGFRAFRRESLERLDVLDSRSNGYSFQIENSWRSSRLGLTTTEVPITFTDRTTGTSKMSAAIVREAIALVLVWRWNEIRHGLHLGASPARQSFIATR